MDYKHNTPPESNKPSEQFERVTILRSAHARRDGTYCTSASFIVSASGVRLLAGRHVTKRTPANVLQFPARPRPTSPTGEKRRAA
jgi:hypothetical protein